MWPSAHSDFQQIRSGTLAVLQRFCFGWYKSFPACYSYCVGADLQVLIGFDESLCVLVFVCMGLTYVVLRACAKQLEP